MMRHRKIDVYIKNEGVWEYYWSTTVCKTCKEAVHRFLQARLGEGFTTENVRAEFAV